MIASGTTTYSFIARPGIGSNGFAVFDPAMLRSSPKRTTILSWYVPANMFPFRKSAGYPNIGRDMTLGSAGFAFSKAAIRSGGDFFQAMHGLFARLGLIACSECDRTSVLEDRQAERRADRDLRGPQWQSRSWTVQDLKNLFAAVSGVTDSSRSRHLLSEVRHSAQDSPTAVNAMRYIGDRITFAIGLSTSRAKLTGLAAAE